MRKHITPFLLSLPLLAAAQTIDLGGKWTVHLPSGTSAQATLPGTLDMNGVGQPNTLIPSMDKPQLLRLTRRVSYIGPCTYTRQIDIPADMADRPLRLKMERVLWKSTLEVDGKPIAQENHSLTTPHYFDIPPLSKGGHTFAITVDNSKQYDISTGDLCHSYTNDTQTMWNGVLGDFSLSVIPAIQIENVQVYPDLDKGGVEVRLTVNNSGHEKRSRFGFKVNEKDSRKNMADIKTSFKVPAGKSVFKQFLPIKDARLWSDITPELYTLTVTDGKTSRDATFGMREVSTRGKDMLVNGRRVFLRGTLDCCVFPLTGVPPTDKAGWINEMQTLRDWGFNHIRFHSWCPPEAAFQVADSLGMYIQTELPVWSLKIGDDPAVTEFLTDEFRRMSEQYGNHPSWIMSTCGNELQHDFNTLNGMVKEMRELDPRHLYAATSFTFEKGHGGHAEPYDQFLVTQWTDDGWVRGQGVFDEETPAFDRNYASSMGCVSVPLVSHEIGQYAVYPDITEIGRYTGVLDPLNFKAIKNDLARKGLLDKAGDYLDATAKFAKILYKEEIERALKTPGFSGVQLLGIQDFPGQGTALVGLINSFWESKGVVNAEEFSRFNAPVVPLADFPKAVYTASDMFRADISVANYGDGDLTDGDLTWTLTDEAEHMKSGSIHYTSLPQGEVSTVDSIAVSLEDFAKPSKLTLSVNVPGESRGNSWNIWVYPEIKTPDYGYVTVTSSLPDALQALDKGKKVLFMPERSKVNGIESKFLPVFWSPVHFPKQAGGMGVLADSDHPALQGFPNDSHSDWQWWVPAKNASVMKLDSITDRTTGRNIEPIVGVIDNFLHNRRLGYLFESRCGNGSLMVSSIDLTVDSPEMKSLLAGILRYMNSDSFAPEDEISPETLGTIISGTDNDTKTTSTSIYE